MPCCTQVSLNEGGHQLRFYHGDPDGSVPFSESCQVGKRVIPGASLLVRLVKNRGVGPQRHSLEVSNVFYCLAELYFSFRSYSFINVSNPFFEHFPLYYHFC